MLIERKENNKDPFDVYFSNLRNIYNSEIRFNNKVFKIYRFVYVMHIIILKICLHNACACLSIILLDRK
jgi:hypothetical protein